jgi:hypothetical protein
MKHTNALTHADARTNMSFPCIGAMRAVCVFHLGFCPLLLFARVTVLSIRNYLFPGKGSAPWYLTRSDG